MQMNLTDMVVFAKVVETRNFSMAARFFGITTSAVSRSIQRLERTMGARLLNRTTRAMTVTDFGQEIYVQCARIADTSRAVLSLAGQHAAAPRGLLKVAAPVAYGQLCLTPMIPSFLERWPELKVQLELTDRSVDVVGEGIDVAIRIAGELPPRVSARPIGTMSYVLAATPAYLERFGVPTEPADLQPEFCVFTGDTGSAGEVRMVRGREEFNLRASPRLVINDGAAIVAALQRHAWCVGLVPDYAVADAFRSGALHKVLADWSFEDSYRSTPINVIYSPTRHLSISVRAFIDHLIAECNSAQKKDTEARGGATAHNVSREIGRHMAAALARSMASVS
jgi:DNA-binding transcriptional LysR family regulator